MRQFIILILLTTLISCKYVKKSDSIDKDKSKYHDSYVIYCSLINDDIKFSMLYCDSLLIKQSHQDLYNETFKLYDFISSIIDTLDMINNKEKDCLDDSGIINRLMIGDNNDKLAMELRNKADDYKTFVSNLYHNPRIDWIVDNRLNFYAIQHGGEIRSWESYNFNNIPIVAAKYRLLLVQDNLLKTLIEITLEL